MRVFFGLSPDPGTSMNIADWRDRQLACAGTPVPVTNFHITLAFIGALEDSAIERLCLSVDHWLTHNAMSGATLQLDSTGYWHKPGIYWLGPENWPGQLSRLAQKLNSLGSAAEAKRDRNAFRPHITLYRQCYDAPPAALQAPSIPMTYTRVALFESRQGKSGVSYHILQDWALQSTAVQESCQDV
ncbi:RNA 2',3'-cyclic phosphodiesterase [Halioglobus japonicus]|nr:RNA 2',3'-cyclic phosphodiesterase [Halioglobus japonicus]